VRWLKRYFNFSKFPEPAKALMRRALKAEGIFIAALGVLLWRITYLHQHTYDLAGKYIVNVGGAGYSPNGTVTDAVAPPTWESFLISEFADRDGLSAGKIEIEIVWALLAAIILAFGAFILVIDWRKPREAHYRPSLYLLTVVNLGLALGVAALADSKVVAVIVTGAEILVLVLFLLRPAPRVDWRGRV